MQTTSALLTLAALAGTSFAQISDEAYCSSVQSSFFATLFAAAPTTPADILSVIATATGVPDLPMSIDPSKHQDQLCAIATALPSSLLPEFQSFAAELLEFGKERSDELIDYVTACYPESRVESYTSYIDYVFTATGNICTETAAPGSGANSTTPTGTGSVYPTATPTSSYLIPTAAAARPTGALMGAAAAGIIGAAAML